MVCVFVSSRHARTGAAGAHEGRDRARERPEGNAPEDRNVASRVGEMHPVKLHDALGGRTRSTRCTQRSVARFPIELEYCVTAGQGLGAEIAGKATVPRKVPPSRTVGAGRPLLRALSAAGTLSSSANTVAALPLLRYSDAAEFKRFEKDSARFPW